jgi:hypothetical protein
MPSANKLDKKDFFGKSGTAAPCCIDVTNNRFADPYFVISRMRDGGGFVPVYQSEVIKKTLDPNWKYSSLSRSQTYIFTQASIFEAHLLFFYLGSYSLDYAKGNAGFAKFLCRSSARTTGIASCR